MGQIADDMIEGRACVLCGQYFENKEKPDELFSHGQPVVCKECWSDLTKEEKKEYTRAQANNL